MARNRTKPGGNAFGMFGGVFTPSILTILGLILFMRANQVVGYVGVPAAIAILIISTAITFLTALSISAISTNMQVRGGGAYFLISRVLGPEFGGAIGLALYAALALSVPFYFLGFTEALVKTFASLEPYFLVINLSALAVFFGIAYVGASWAIKTQFFIMLILVAAIAAFLTGTATHFSFARLEENMGFADPVAMSGVAGFTALSFWAAFAIYFPAVTGIDAGVNMSGDLEDPMESIPKGTLLAVLVGFCVYATQIVLSGGAYERADLITKPFKLLTENAIFGLGFCVVAGAFAATLSSALGSLLGAPRVLQAVARDGILGVLKPFAKGEGAADEPRRAALVTGVAAIAVLLWAGNSAQGGALNAVAAIITMFFLYSYGMINLAAFTEAFGDSPSFRPRFRFFHWSTALLGALGSVAVAFMINPLAASIAALLIGGLVLYVKSRRFQATFGDARRGFVLGQVRGRLMQLVASDQPDDAKSWRPAILVFAGSPAARAALVRYAVWLEAGSGFVFLANVLVGDIKELSRHRAMAIRQLEEFCREQDVFAFPSVVLAPTVEAGISTLMQTAGLGPIQPNLVLFGWSDYPERVIEFAGHLRIARDLGISALVVKVPSAPSAPSGQRIDIWWRGRDNGALMLMLAHLLTENPEWKGEGTVRVIRVVEHVAGYEPAVTALQKLIDDARVDAQAHAILRSDRAFPEVLFATSKDAGCVFLGFPTPEPGEEGAWRERYQSLLSGLPTVVMVNALKHTEELLD